RTAGLWFGGLVATLLAVGVASAWLNPNPTGSASASLQFRTEFAATSARMLASAPVGGVGIGQYYPRSHEYMSDELRAYYPYENAHNYFLQAFAELGLLGGALFLSVVATGLRLGWSALRAQPASPALSGLFAGCCGYLLTCVTGHPLLVPEAALPFWAAFGAMAGASPAGGTAPAPWFRKGAAAAATVLGVLLVLALVESRRQPGIPADRGFHDERVADDGTRFRWSTRHAVAWLQGDPGFLTLLVRAPELPGRPRPFIVQLEADGHVLQRTPVPTDRWLQIGAPVPRRPDGARRRIDLRVNQVWTERRDRPGPGVTDDRPLGVMVGYPNLQEVPK
ncbi:MAG: O-antigen ligase family protein, partial [Acidimicrobiia bacterium]|nr:O-antigen ligase family protein [Acidimicrobiia bacterium]